MAPARATTFSSAGESVLRRGPQDVVEEHAVLAEPRLLGEEPLDGRAADHQISGRRYAVAVCRSV